MIEFIAAKDRLIQKLEIEIDRLENIINVQKSIINNNDDIIKELRDE